MRLRATLLALIFAALGTALAATAASATVRISDDQGGQIGRYVQAFGQLSTSGERVVIDGACLSACTLVLGMVPHERICVTSRALLGFHAAWYPDDSGRPVRSDNGTLALWEVYPQQIRSWISRHGGLKAKMIFLRGRDLARLYPSCTQSASGSALRVNSDRPRRGASAAQRYRR